MKKKRLTLHYIQEVWVNNNVDSNWTLRDCTHNSKTLNYIGLRAKPYIQAHVEGSAELGQPKIKIFIHHLSGKNVQT